MSTSDHEILSQYLDGELGASQVQQLERRLGQEPGLRSQLERLQSVNASLVSAFDIPGADTVPASVTRMVTDSGNSNVIAFPQRHKAGLGFAVAASLLAASGLLFFDQSQPGVPAGTSIDTLLVQELENTPSRGDGWNLLADGRKMRPVLSFQRVDNTWCREYMLETQGQQWHGVACRSETQWTTAVLSPAEGLGSSAAEFRPASAGDTDQVQDFVDSQALDIALSLKREAQLIKDGWK
ncbi:MAG: hypothetical protein V7709_11565 [Halioglobus sp.]